MSGGTVAQRRIDGYINATEVCNLSGKKVSAWKRSKEAQELIEQLSTDVQICTSALVYSQKGGLEQGTWVHPDLAIPLAMWASSSFAITVSRWMQDWIALNANIQAEKESQISIEQAMSLADWSAPNMPGLNPEVTQVLRLQTFAELRPDLGHAFDPIIKAIGSSNPLPGRTYTPTEIGEILGQDLGVNRISAIAVNKKLSDLGYQESVVRVNSKGKEVHHYYQISNKGQEFGQLELAPFKTKGGSGTKPNARWYRKVVDILVENWNKQARNN